MLILNFLFLLFWFFSFFDFNSLFFILLFFIFVIIYIRIYVLIHSNRISVWRGCRKFFSSLFLTGISEREKKKFFGIIFSKQKSESNKSIARLCVRCSNAKYWFAYKRTYKCTHSNESDHSQSHRDNSAGMPRCQSSVYWLVSLRVIFLFNFFIENFCVFI